MTDQQHAVTILKQGADIVLPADGIDEKLALAAKEGRPLRVKLGFDPTSSDLHLGHAVILRKLKEFQDLGHDIILIIGDFTARIGDPSGRNKTRPPLSTEEIDQNAQTYLDQVGKVLDVSRISLRRNSEWLGKMNLADTLKLLASYNLGRMLSRDDFKNRFTNEQPIAMHELAYPLLQGYDSVVLEADIEIGGTDQLFNLQVGRDLQEQRGQQPQTILCMPLLRGLDGKDKMSKSLANYIGLTDEPKDMFGKVMSVPDELMPEYIALTTTFDQLTKDELLAELKGEANPMELKKRVAANIVEQYYTAEVAVEAGEYFYRQFQDKSRDQVEYREVKLVELELNADSDLVDILLALRIRPSKSECRRLISQGGVTLNDQKVEDPKLTLGKLATSEIYLRAGKLEFYKIII
jgi:tyrosyl-tRNA synthetase